ncbi:olfactory receptor 6-like [Hemicordylus capensis]|uniref:olfactory receptor 6-like n=1 Tax=Hemicordylus capensis TaxID=884348 RepID=UPI00230273F2|nr:olfactory receptor 6-like [Hemicordylus capensis]
MGKVNQTIITEFILLGFPTSENFQFLLFFLFLFSYLMVLAENIIIMMAVWMNCHLHKPMYYFLFNMSFLEVWYISVTIPKMLLGFLTQSKLISFAGCMTQLYFFVSLACTECVLLAVMAYDRYVAICFPLHYSIIMSTRLCFQLAGGSWMSGFTISVFKVSFISQLTFCGSNIINHFFCDISPVLQLACTDMSLAELVDFVLAIIILVFPLCVTVLSYIYIIATILRIPSVTGRNKAFSTCASHLTVVIIYYTAMIFMYVRPKAITSYDSNKLISSVYAVLTPMLNPFIYCLRNTEVKKAIWRTVGGKGVI